MRIALCYYGALGGWKNKDGDGGPIPPSIGFRSIERHIIEANAAAEVDVFVHSWSKDHESAIVNTVRPIRYEIEPQRDFSVLASSCAARANRPAIHHWNELRPAVSSRLRSASRKHAQYLREHTFQSAFRIASRFYSSYRAVELKKRHERDVNREYDFVMLLRFDMELAADINFGALDPRCFYTSRWDCGVDLLGRKRTFTNWNFQDYWFIGGTRIIDTFADVCFLLPNYSVCAHRASYQHVKKFIGLDAVRYLLMLGDDYELIRRRHHTSTEVLVASRPREEVASTR